MQKFLLYRIFSYLQEHINKMKKFASSPGVMTSFQNSLVSTIPIIYTGIHKKVSFLWYPVVFFLLLLPSVFRYLVTTSLATLAGRA